MPTFSELYSSSLDHELGTDDSTRLFTTSRRKRAINDGVLWFADVTECFLRQSTVTCSNGVREYNLLSTVNVPGGDYLRLSKQGIEYHLISSGSSASTNFQAGPDDLPRRDIGWLNQYEPGWRASTGATPTAYYERSDGGRRFLGLNPPPDIGSSETGKVILPYVAKPQTLTDDTHVPFYIASTAAGASTGIRTDLEPFHQGLVHYAASELERLRLNQEGVQRQLQLAMSYVQRYLGTSVPKGPQQVRLGRNYFTDARGRGEGFGPHFPDYPWRQS